MGRRRPVDPKIAALREDGTLHPHPERVQHPLFAEGSFFDRRDIVQVKYEMLRRAQVEGEPVARCASTFGLSRPTFYQVQAAVARTGLAGLVPRKRGPRGAHKLTAEVMAFVEEQRGRGPSIGPSQLVELIKKRFKVQVHPRTIGRALNRSGKGGR